MDLIEKTASEHFSGIQAAGGDVATLVEMGPESFFNAAKALDPKLPPVDSKSKVAEAVLMEVARKARA